MNALNPSELLAQLRQQQFYMVTMQANTPTEDPLSILGPNMEEHLNWLIEQENNGTLFLSGAAADETEWDGSGVAIIRARSRAHAEQIAETEPFHRAGLRTNTVRGWQLNEGNVTVKLKLFDNSFEIN
ncbi:YciI family protein [Subtercola lobariae]|uniref:YCII-related domain-containing protein n=1 Tax=Subtercola lobariae TaxID=1588641 RepID=A0A917EYH6_9MICO|nr:YciI family protein [Subtercola lobariae]GGF22774.1 hypothetical protein GCM10011399_15530 [Subtercola lobariae]